MVQEHWNPAAWKVNWYSIGESGCIDCPGTTAESCRDDGAYLNRITFEDCIEICAGGNNPNNVQMYEPYLDYVFAQSCYLYPMWLALGQHNTTPEYSTEINSQKPYDIAI